MNKLYASIMCLLVTNICNLTAAESPSKEMGFITGAEVINFVRAVEKYAYAMEYLNTIANCVPPKNVLEKEIGYAESLYRENRNFYRNEFLDFLRSLHQSSDQIFSWAVGKAEADGSKAGDIVARDAKKYLMNMKNNNGNSELNNITQTIKNSEKSIVYFKDKYGDRIQNFLNKLRAENL